MTKCAAICADCGEELQVVDTPFGPAPIVHVLWDGRCSPQGAEMGMKPRPKHPNLTASLMKDLRWIRDQMDLGPKWKCSI